MCILKTKHQNTLEIWKDWGYLLVEQLRSIVLVDKEQLVGSGVFYKKKDQLMAGLRNCQVYRYTVFKWCTLLILLSNFITTDCRCFIKQGKLIVCISFHCHSSTQENAFYNSDWSLLQLHKNGTLKINKKQACYKEKDAVFSVPLPLILILKGMSDPVLQVDLLAPTSLQVTVMI